MHVVCSDGMMLCDVSSMSACVVNFESRLSHCRVIGLGKDQITQKLSKEQSARDDSNRTGCEVHMNDAGA